VVYGAQELGGRIMELLKVENLCKAYGKNENQVAALNNI
jgi:hypothetical protein